MNELTGKRIAVLATDGVEESELVAPLEALEDAGAEAHVLSPKSGTIQAYQHDEKGDDIPVDHTLDEVKADDYDGLVLPGGVINPDRLRLKPEAINFVRHFVRSGKPIAAICHGPWTLIDADGVRGRKMTSWPSLKADLSNAGAVWVDQPVVVDNGLVTSRRPDDLQEFCAKMIEEFAEGRHARSSAAE
jgi:protease I